MKEATRNFLVGLFLLLSLAALGTLMVWFGETPSFLRRSEWTLRIVGVRDLNGINEGSPVRFNGVEVGRVTGIEFRNPERPDLGAVILASIKRKYAIPRGAYARVYGAMLGFGTGYVEIVIRNEAALEPLNPADAPTIAGEMRSAFSEVISQQTIGEVERAIGNIADLTEAWTPVGGNLADLLEQRPIAEVMAPDAAERGITPNLSTAVQRLDRLVSQLNEVLGDDLVKDDVKGAIRDLKGATEELKEVVSIWKSQSQRVGENLNEGIDHIEANLDRSFAQLNQVLEDLDESARTLSGVLQKVSSGEGTLGLLVHDARLYEAAVLSLERFADAMGSFNRLIRAFEEQGYITLGQAPSGLLKQNIPFPEEEQ